MRLRILASLVLLLVLALGLVLADAPRRRSTDRERARARARLAAALGLPDLALSSDARWLRHPSQVEPAAAIADAPGALDVDPAGAWIAPPRAVLGRRARAFRVEVRTR